jgi:hypothetical protein
MHDAMSGILGTRTQVQHGNELGQRIDHHPQPERMCLVPQSGPQFVELEVRETEVWKYWSCSIALCAPARASQVVMVRWLWPNTRPAAATSSPSESAVSTSAIRSDDVLRRSQRSVAPGAERTTTGLAAKRLDAFRCAMRPIPNQRMELGIRDAIVRAGWCWAGEARGGDAFGLATAAFDFVPRAYGWAGSRGSSRTSGLLAAGKTIVWCPRSQQALHLRRDRSLRRPTPPPRPGQPPQTKQHEQHEPAHSSHHTVPYAMSSARKKFRRSIEEGQQGCHVAQSGGGIIHHSQ